MSSLHQKIETFSQQIFDKVSAYRRHLHQYPELSFQEVETVKFVRKTLQEIGIKDIQNCTETGLIAIIRGEHHTEHQNCIALRADMDALPILEENTHEFVSKNLGVMHACGHDVHTSVLMGTAEILFLLRDELPQPVKLIFQPGEEKNPGGASLMIKQEVLKNPKVDRIYGLHVFPDLEAGKVGFRKGLYMASSDEIYITVNGKGGHGATPNDCIDPIFIGASIVTQLQQIVSRKCDPKTPCVLSIGHFEAIGATNIIPSKAVLKGTFRTMNEVWRAEALQLIQQQCERIAQSLGGTADVEISKGYPYLENNPEVTEQLHLKAISFLGDDNCIDLPIRMTSEDFAFYSQEVPACFFRLGVRNEAKGITYGVHHPKFDADFSALLTGMQIMSLAAF